MSERTLGAFSGADPTDGHSRDADPSGPTAVVAFLRAVNVGGTNKLSMAQLRRIAGLHGWANPRTYLASGNLMGELEFSDSDSASALAAAEADLERAIAEAMGLDTTVMIRTRRELVEVAARVPFQAPVEQCHVGFFKAVRRPDGIWASAEVSNAAAQLRALVAPDEFVLSGGEVFLRYQADQARTKLTVAALTRIVGSPVTVRGLRTVTGVRDRC